MKLMASIVCLITGSALAGTWYVTPDAAADGAGTSWDAPCAITNVAAKIAANDVVLVKAGDYAPAATIAFTKNVTVRGGMKGTDDTTLAETPYSVLDGRDTLSSIMTYSATLTIYNLEFTRGFEHGVCNSAYDKHLRAYDCRFIANGTQLVGQWNYGTGRALQCYGQAADFNGTCIISNCYFAGNAQVKTGNGQSGGGPVDVRGLNWTKIYDCTFVTNGVAWNYPTGSQSFSWGSGGGLISSSGPIEISGCKFFANRVSSSTENSNYRSPLIYCLQPFDSSWRSRFSKLSWIFSISNCVFAGNHSVASSTGSMGGAATAPVFVADCMGDLATCRVDKCTFAYNSFDTTAGSGGVSVQGGTVFVRNSIFYGNKIAQSGTQGCDLKTTSASSVLDVDYCLFSDTGDANIYAAVGSVVTKGSHLVTGNPLFTSPLSAVEPLIVTDGSLRYYANDFATAEALMALDLRVTDSSSKAIDAADPACPYDREPSPNGERMNLGYYGNTPFACKTAIAQPEVPGGVSLTFPYGTTQPRVAFTLGGAPSLVYSATAKIEWSTNGTDYATYKECAGLANGDSVDELFMTAFRQGDILDVRVTVSAYGATNLVYNLSETLAYPMPPSFGKGGGAGILHVRPDATGDGSGSDWFHAAPSLAALFAQTAYRTASEIWIAGTNVVTATTVAHPYKNIVVRGGFVGTENAAGERPSGTYTVFTGEDRRLTSFVAGCAGTVRFERLSFEHGGDCGASLSYNESNTRVTLDDCRVMANGLPRVDDYRTLDTRGLSVTGNGTSSLTVTNCYFGGNVRVKTGSVYVGGSVVGISLLDWADFVNCTFITNGVAWDYPRTETFQFGGRPCLMNASGVRTRLAGCVFRANRIASTQSAYGDGYASPLIKIGGVAASASAPWGVSLTNCLFAGNESVASTSGQYGHASTSPLYYYSTYANITCCIDNCTFAYNQFDTEGGTAGLMVESGAVKVRNSIFYGNRIAKSGTSGCDIKTCGSSAYVDIDYSLFGGTGSSNIFATAGTVAVGDHVIVGDPLFVTPFSEMEALLADDGEFRYYATNQVALAKIIAADLHVTNKTSRAIDAGDPAYPYEREPSPNGSRINLGFYGGTPEACKTAIAQPEFVGDPELTFPYGTTQPRVRFTLGGGADETYSATVTLEWSTNGMDYVVYREMQGYGYGDEFDHVLATAFRSGGTLSVRVSIGAFGATTRTKTVSAALTNPCPASFGKGGGAGVLHVRPGATGDGSGSDWFNAMTEMSALPYSAAFATAAELWVAGTNVVTTTPEVLSLSDKAVRGGFAGTENVASERQPGSLTVFDGGDREVTTFVAACSGTVLFERLAFVRGGTRGVSLSCQAANTAITLQDCRVEDNAVNRALDWMWTNTGSLGLSASGNSTSTLTLTNCTVVGNALRKNSAQEGDGAVVIDTFKRAYLLDCLFEANGVCWTNAVGTSAKINGCGEAALTVSAPATLIGCMFRANRVGAMWSGYPYRSAIARLGGVGNALTNCLFLANESVYKYGSDCGTTHAGVLLLGSSASTDIENCTFAYNTMAQTAAGAAITVEGGTLKVRNSIFVGNRQYPGTATGADIWLNGSSGTLDVDYTMFESVDAAHLYANSGCTISTNDASVLYSADPKLCSSLTDYAALLSRPDGYGRVFPPTAEGLAKVQALNAHLRGRAGYFDEKSGKHVSTLHGNSPAIDAGDPSAAYANEPMLDRFGTNGRRINLGCYGNTPWATMTGLKGAFLRLR